MLCVLCLTAFLESYTAKDVSRIGPNMFFDNVESRNLIYLQHNRTRFFAETLLFCLLGEPVLCDLLESGSAVLRAPLNGRKLPSVAVRR